MSKKSRKEKNRQKRANKQQSRNALQEWQQQRGIHEFAQKLRENMPASEVWFLELFKLENLGIYLNNNVVIGYYIADYVYKRLILEIDDPTHLTPEQQLKDKQKDSYYNSQGYRVVRVKAWDQTSYNESIKKIKSYLADEKYKQTEKDKEEWKKNKKIKNKKKNKDKVLNIRTRPLTEWEQKRLDYIKKKKSMK